MDGSSKRNDNFIVHKVGDSFKKDGKIIKSIKWMDHPRKMEISPVHKVDGPPKRMEVSLNT